MATFVDVGSSSRDRSLSRAQSQFRDQSKSAHHGIWPSCHSSSCPFLSFLSSFSNFESFWQIASWCYSSKSIMFRGRHLVSLLCLSSLDFGRLFRSSLSVSSQCILTSVSFLCCNPIISAYFLSLQDPWSYICRVRGIFSSCFCLGCLGRYISSMSYKSVYCESYNFVAFDLFSLSFYSRRRGFLLPLLEKSRHEASWDLAYHQHDS